MTAPGTLIRSVALLLGSFFSILLAACGDDTDVTEAEISLDELSQMVLQLPDFGSSYVDLQLNQEASGVHENEDVVADSFDPEDDRGDLDRFGRTTGYASTYTSPETVRQTEGVFHAASAVSLYNEADGASGDLRDEIEDALRSVGAKNDGLVLEAAEEFEAGSIADESAGLTLTLTPSGGRARPVYGTLVAFRRGRIVGSTFLVSFDRSDSTEDASEAALTLDQRILAVLTQE